ncbi:MULTISPECIES: glycine-rich domain-containing protein [Micromonospora]|uniref:hypothetical protein n=1 Tax=Micromonospora TaxID=1873 RepID=UPI000F413B2D|nr:hypothetical protein [Micromonospora aurantiaca]RNH98595.1 hypothetical protein EEZ25_26195 [Micromonospora aurantiaca]
MSITADKPVTTVAQDPRTLVSTEVFDKLTRYFAARQEVSHTYAERAVGQFLVFLKAHADQAGKPDFGMLLPTGESYRVVPTRAVDAVWHALLQISEPYTAACHQIAGHYVHHRPILTEAMRDGTAITYTLAALHDTGYQIDMEFWGGEAESCCPPNPPQPGR